MKRAKLLHDLGVIAKNKGLTLDLVRHGSRHDIYEIGGVRLTVGRHSDIPEHTARGTLDDARGA